MIENNEIKNYIEKNIYNEFNSLFTESTSIISKSEQTQKEKLKRNKSQKHVLFSTPFFTIIEVESFINYNEDISETRFYFNLPELNPKKKKIKIIVNVYYLKYIDFYMVKWLIMALAYVL